MTATIVRPRAQPTPSPSSRPPAAPTSPPAATGVASEVALTVLTLAAALSFGRLFSDGSFLLPVAVAAIAAHAIAATCRRLALPAPAAVLITIASVFVLTAWLVLPETTVAGIPWSGTWTAMREQASQALAQFREVVAPAPVTDGFLVATVIGTMVAAYLSDWAAFRIGATFESAVPSFTLFIFSSYLGTDHHQSVALLAFGAALILYVALHHARTQAATSTWFASTTQGATTSALRGAGAIGGVALVAALFIGPNLPGADEKAVISREGRTPGSGSRTTVSPLVDIRGRLVDNSDIEVFSVRADNRSYWRLTSLDTFNGDIWSSNESYRPARRGLPGVQPDLDSDVFSTQEFTVSSLASIWLPAAYEPQRITGVDAVSYSADSGSLISRFDTSDGLQYTVQSRMPRPSAAELAAAPDAFSPAPEYLALPDISGRVRQEAIRVAGRESPYQQAINLQRYFRGGSFRYDLRVTQGHGGDALERFLFENKRGYCEQFAGAYAVMARAVGLPARVAVGFTPGELGDDGRYHVRALNAHAWPEVYIEGAGWIAFEPTPGRGMPGAEEYTGISEAQANVENPTTATTASPTTAAPQQNETAGQSTTTTAVVDASGDAGGDGNGFVARVRLPVAVVVAAAALYAVAVPMLKQRRRQRRRAAATTPSEAVLAAWADAGDSLAVAGLPRRPAETPAEYASRVARAGRLPERPVTEFRTLASDVAAAEFAAEGASPDGTERAAKTAENIRIALRARATAWDRIRWALDPRQLLN